MEAQRISDNKKQGLAGVPSIIQRGHDKVFTGVIFSIDYEDSVHVCAHSGLKEGKYLKAVLIHGMPLTK